MPRLAPYCSTCRLPMSGYSHKACREARKVHGKDVKLRHGECDMPGCGAKNLGLCMTFIIPCDHRYCHNCGGSYRRTTNSLRGITHNFFCVVCGKKVKGYFG